MVKHLTLSYDNDVFEKLKNTKEKHEKTTKERISWEDFVFMTVCGK